MVQDADGESTGTGTVPVAAPQSMTPSAALPAVDDTLFLDARAGCPTSLDRLVQREWSPVRAVIARSVRDDGEVDDLTQEVFERVLRRLGDFEPGDVPFRAYLAQTARNLLRDRWRQQQRQQRPRTDLGVPESEVSASDPAAEVIEAFDRLALIEVLRKLPAAQRAVLRMRILEGRSTREVAARLGRSEEAVRQIQHRALLYLRREYVLDAFGDLSDGGPARSGLSPTGEDGRGHG